MGAAIHLPNRTTNYLTQGSHAVLFSKPHDGKEGHDDFVVPGLLIGTSDMECVVALGT
jgi:hypothetical protein